MAALQAFVAVQLLTDALEKVRQEVEMYRHVPGWMFWRRIPENYGAHLVVAVSWLQAGKDAPTRGYDGS